jgi:RHS repeat-associated protein
MSNTTKNVMASSEPRGNTRAGWQPGNKLPSNGKLCRALLVLVSFLVCSTLTQAQQQGESGVQFTQGDVNESATLSLAVPIGKYKGRGLDLPISLSYSSNLWRIEHVNKVRNYEMAPPYYVVQSVAQAIYAEHSAAGWKSTLDLPKVEFPKQTDAYDYKAKPYPSATQYGCYGYRISRLYVHMPDGSTHEFRESDQPYYSNDIDEIGTFYAVDSSRMRFDSTGSGTGTLYLPDGTRYVLGHPTSSIIDRNGNTQTFNETTRKWTDTVGREILNPLPATTPTAPLEYDYDLPGLSGPVRYHFKWLPLAQSLAPNADAMRYVASEYLPSPNSLPTNSGQENFPVTQSSQYLSLFHTAAPEDVVGNPEIPTLVVGKGQTGGQVFDPVVLNEIALPDGTTYQFRYNIYGELSKITYPTTAYEQYDYADGGVDDEQQPYDQAQRRISKRQLSINGLGTDILEWTYLETPQGYGNPVDDSRYRVISIIAPDKTRTEIFNYDPVADDGQQRPYWPFGFSDSRAGLVFQRKYFSTSVNGLGGQLLRREITKYAQTAHGYPFSGTCDGSSFSKNITAYRNPRPVKKVSIIFEGSGPALAQTDTFDYDSRGEMTTGVDQTVVTNRGYVVVTNSTAETGTLIELSIGDAIRSSQTSYLNIPEEPNSSTYIAKNILGFPTVTKVIDANNVIVSQSEMRYDESPYSPEIGRALATSSRVWDSGKGVVTNPDSYLMTHAKFDIYGNRIEAIDAKGNTTITEYDSSHHAFAEKTITPVPDPSPLGNPDGLRHGSGTAFESTTTYDYETGLVQSTTDLNGQLTQFEYIDPLLRPTRVIPPVGGAQTISEYGLGTTEATRYVRIKHQVDENNWKEATSFYDGLGRTFKTQLKDANGDVFSETRYDNMGRVQQVTNPYRTDETKVWISNTYDDLGRILRVTTPDSAQMQTSYGLSTTDVIGTTKTNTDQANRKRSGITDALGRMVRVIEDPDHQSLVADYVFDTLGNIRQTIQGEQSRYFLCDSLGRVLYSKQPEQEVNTSLTATDAVTGHTEWAMKFTYDDNGNNTSTTDPRNITVSVGYDQLNRLIFRDYSDTTPAVSFFYDGSDLEQAPAYSKGQITRIGSSVSESRNIAFDNLGRIKSSQQVTNGVTYNFPDYTYDLAGNLKSETYPSGRVVRNTLDANGNLSKVESQKDSNSTLAVYLDQIKYTASYAVKESRLGNGLWETTSYNNRLQVIQIGLGSSNTNTNLLKIAYDYGTATQNNGALREQKITAAGLTQPIVQSYGYDDLNRLETATETYAGGVPSWQQTFSYDRFGNRRFAAGSTIPNGGPPAVANPLINTSDNRFSTGQGYVYDKAGSLTQDAESHRFAYDGESRQTKFFNSTNTSENPDATYLYDGAGQRVRKLAGQLETVFVYDAGGQLIAEYSNDLPANPKQSYLTADHLGSPRIVTDQNGQVISRHDYMGFGEEVSTAYANRLTTPGYGGADGIRQQFTGQERDTESGLDYAQARYYNSRHGRFTSADPLTASATIRDPQTFNRYSYVTNSPYKFTDPLGLFGVCPGGGQGGQGGMPLGANWGQEAERQEAVEEPPLPTSQDNPQRRQEDRVIYVFVGRNSRAMSWEPDAKSAAKGYKAITVPGDDFAGVKTPKGPTIKVITEGESQFSPQGFTEAVGDRKAAAVVFVGDTYGYPDSESKYHATGLDFGVNGRLPATTTLQVNAMSLAIFACDSQSLGSMFSLAGRNQSFIGMYSGSDGYTSPGWLGRAAFAAAGTFARGGTAAQATLAASDRFKSFGASAPWGPKNEMMPITIKNLQTNNAGDKVRKVR